MHDVVWIHYSRPRTPWYSLDDAGRGERHAKFDAARQASRTAGATQSGPFFIRGQSDYSDVEVWTFPDVDAAFEHWGRLVDVGYAEWFESANSVGMRNGARDA